MTTIILVSIGILLAAVATLFVIFYGGDAFNGGDVKAQADMLENAGLNVESAQTGYVAANGGLATSLADLKGVNETSWLKEDPSLARVSASTQTISDIAGTVAYTLGGVSKEVCRRVNVDYGLKDARSAELPTSMDGATRGCYKSGTDYVYYVRFSGAAAGGGTTSTQQTVMATSIVLHAGIASSCIQVAEIEVYSNGVNVAAAAAGGIATGSAPYSPEASPANAIDGVKPAGYPNIYHSQCNGGDYLQVTFTHAVPVDSVVVYGRADYGAARDIYSYQLLNGTEVVTAATVDATSGSGSSTPKPLPPALPEPAAPTISSQTSVYAAYASWLATEYKRKAPVLGNDAALGFIRSKVSVLTGSHITGVYYENAGWYSRYGFSNPEPYIYFTLQGDDQPYSPWCLAWKTTRPSNMSDCDNYYGNHFTVYFN